jgi:hypothetical protein
MDVQFGPSPIELPQAGIVPVDSTLLPPNECSHPYFPLEKATYWKLSYQRKSLVY